MHPQQSPLPPVKPPVGRPLDREQRQARLLDKARRLRRLARNGNDLWLADQYETAASLL